MARQLISEAAGAASAAAQPVVGKPGRFLVQIIDQGWGATGYYSAEVLEAAAASKVFPAGTKMYLDHPMADGSGQDIHGNRSVKDLAATLAGDAYYDSTLKSLVAESSVFAPYKDVLAEMKDAIGLSMRAWADAEPGSAEGRTGLIVNELVEARSIDFVTEPGRGGKILQVIESARQKMSVEEATSNNTRSALDDAVDDAYGSNGDPYVWTSICDFDDTNVWFWMSQAGDRDLYQLAYTIDDALNVTFSGDPIEVRQQVIYIPVGPDGEVEESATHSRPGHPAGRSKKTTTPKEPLMGHIQVEESEHRRLTEAAGRVQTLESERDAAVQRAETAESERDAALARETSRDRGVAIARLLTTACESAKVELNEFERSGVAAKAVVKDGALDESATKTAFDEALVKVAESRGHGKVRGLGGAVTSTVTPTPVDESAFDELDALAFGAITAQEA